MTRRTFPRVLLVLLTLAAAQPVLGVVELKQPISELYKTARAVIVGKVTKVTPETGAVEASATTILKGDGFTGPFRIAIKLEGLAKNLAADQPIVLMLPRRGDVVINIGGTWVRGEVQQAKLPFYVVRAENAEANHTYPGHTAALVAILQELKDKEKYSLLDKADPRVLSGGIKELGKLPVTGIKAVLARDLDGDKKPELAVSTDQGVKVFSLKGAAWEPSKVAAPEGFPASAPKKPAGADPELTGDALAWATGDFADDGKSARIVVRPHGISREPATDDGKTPPDTFRRLTGDTTTTYPLGFDKGIDWAAATSIDINADGKRDVVIATPTSGVVMVNRGFGAFFVIGNLPKLLNGERALPFKLGAGTFLAAADVDGDGREDLIVVNSEGQVWAVLNPEVK